MIFRTVLFVTALQWALFFDYVHAQEGTSWDGTWKYSHIDKARGWPADVEIRISGDKGTYVAHLGAHKAQNSPCRDKELPVVVQQRTADELVFGVLGSKVLEFCPTFTGRFKRTGPDTAEATIARDQVVSARLER